VVNLPCFLYEGKKGSLWYDLDGRSAKEILETLLGQANIAHTGIFHEPEANP